VLPYVYALRGDRDWRRSPQLTGSRQVSQLAVQAYKLLEAGDATIAELKHALGREVSETAVLRAITELWQQLRIIPVVAAPGVPAKWQLLRHRFQKAIAEGASTSQVTAISVLASIYLQAVIAASMEEVELFLAPLTARSKVREVLRGLVATRQVHTISMGHAPHFYVAGTLPEFAVAPTLYSSSSMPASAYFLRHDDEIPELEPAKTVFKRPEEPIVTHAAAEAPAPARVPAPRPAAVRKPVSSAKPAAARPHFSRPAPNSRDRKPAQSSASNRPARRPVADTRTASARPAGSRPTSGSRPSSTSRPATGNRWSANTANGAKAKHNGNGSGARANGTHSNGAHGNGTRTNGNHTNGTHSKAARPNGTRTNGSSARAANGTSGARTAKSPAAAWNPRTGHGKAANGKPATSTRAGSHPRNGGTPRKQADTRPAARNNRKPALAAGAKAGNSKRYGFTARPKQGTKKRG
jgi:hypothetical protein